MPTQDNNRAAALSHQPRAIQNHRTALRPRTIEHDIKEGLKFNALKTFDLFDLSLENQDEEIKLIGLTVLGSYSWSNNLKLPTIIIPGSPRIWKNLSTPFALGRNNGKVHRDQNSFRFPQFPLLPSIVAVEKCTPLFDWSSVDFVTDRNALRKLLRWIAGAKGRDFRIDVQLVGKATVVFSRWEPKLSESDGAYGFMFEKHTTRSMAGCEDGIAHHRIVKYDFGGFNMVVRFEVDACLQSFDETCISSSEYLTNTPLHASNVDVSALTENLSSLHIATSSANTAKRPLLGLNIRLARRLVPQSSIVELATVNKQSMDKGNYNWKEKFPQLFLTNTPHHFLGVHNQGHFDVIQKRKLGDPFFKEKEEKLQPNLRKLKVALEKIKAVVVDLGPMEKLSLVYQDKKLTLYARNNGKTCLPEEWLRIFDLADDDQK